MEKHNRPIFALTEEEFFQRFDSRYVQKTSTSTPPAISKDELLTLKEVCKLFKKTRQTIRNWAKAKLIDVVIVSGSNYYSKAQILNHLQKKFKDFQI